MYLHLATALRKHISATFLFLVCSFVNAQHSDTYKSVGMDRILVQLVFGIFLVVYILQFHSIVGIYLASC
jgi:hypothetical protein